MAGRMEIILDSLNDSEKLPGVECPESVDGLFWVYIVQCSNRTLYVGHTGNLPKRVKYHETGTGARHTKLPAPIHLVYAEGPMTSTKAIKPERQLKKWSRSKKTALIQGDFENLKALSKSRET